MKTINGVGLFILFAIVCSGLDAFGQDNWPQFRGTGAAGIGLGDVPAEWDVESGKNIIWKQAIPGLAHSSPIVWGDHVFLTTCVNSESDDPALQTGWLGGTGKAVEEKGEWTWQLVCLNRTDGKIRWTKNCASGKPEIKRHLKATHANCTPATDGQHVIAFFGSEGLYCFDFDGNLKWIKDFGRLHSGPYNATKLEWGFASSPVIYKNRVVVQCDCLNASFVSVLDIENGDETKRIERNDVATWSTPAVIETEAGTQIVCNGYKQMASYEFGTGKLLWTLNGGGDVPVPTPLFTNGLIYLTNGHGRTPTYAISPDATGDLTPATDAAAKLPEGLKWWQPRDGSYMPTPIIVDDLLYTCNDNGRLAVRDALTGELVYKQRVSKSTHTFSGSAVATKNHVYFPSEKGVVIVIKTGREYELAAENDMKQVLMTTPAIASNQLFIRTTKHLYCVGDKQ